MTESKQARIADLEEQLAHRHAEFHALQRSSSDFAADNANLFERLKATPQRTPEIASDADADDTRIAQLESELEFETRKVEQLRAIQERR